MVLSQREINAGRPDSNDRFVGREKAIGGADDVSSTHGGILAALIAAPDAGRDWVRGRWAELNRSHLPIAAVGSTEETLRLVERAEILLASGMFVDAAKVFAWALARLAEQRDRDADTVEAIEKKVAFCRENLG